MLCRRREWNFLYTSFEIFFTYTYFYQISNSRCTTNKEISENLCVIWYHLPLIYLISFTTTLERFSTIKIVCYQHESFLSIFITRDLPQLPFATAKWLIQLISKQNSFLDRNNVNRASNWSEFGIRRLGFKYGNMRHDQWVIGWHKQ